MPATSVVSVPEIFNYWLQPGRIDVGFLGAAQIDRFANINTTVIGADYGHPQVRLPGAGGAPEIAASCGEVIIIVRQNLRTFVEKVDFVTSIGFGRGPGDREALGMGGSGPSKVITDLGVLEPDPPLARIAANAVCGVDPQLFGIGPVHAAQQALHRTGIQWEDLAIVELNEAFAAQALACLKLGPDLDPAIVNPQGGAIAIGHPLGASGARILGSLAWQLHRRGAGYGLAAICIGVGQGLAVILEK